MQKEQLKKKLNTLLSNRLITTYNMCRHLSSRTLSFSELTDYMAFNDFMNHCMEYKVRVEIEIEYVNPYCTYVKYPRLHCNF